MIATFFFLILLLSFLIVLLLTRPRTARKSVVKRLNVIHRAPDSAEVDLIEIQHGGKQGRLEQIGALLERLRISRHLATVIRHAGRTDKPSSVLLLSAALAAGCALAGFVFGAPTMLLPVLLAAGALLPYGWLRMKKNKRLAKFNEGLPDTIELMARALRAGHSSGSAIEIVAEQSPEPLGGEFAQCFQQQKFGIPFRESMIALSERVPSSDLHFLVTAILVQKETGGDLIHILERTTAVIRDRVRIEGEVRSYTAQGRLTGWILGSLPLVMLVMINLLAPGYTHVLFHDPLGIKLIYAGVGLISVGAFFIRKVVDIKV